MSPTRRRKGRGLPADVPAQAARKTVPRPLRLKNVAIVAKTNTTPRTVALSTPERIRLASELVTDLFLGTRDKLLKWVPFTGQSAQVDSGYIAQHLVSLVTGIPGIGR